MKLSIPAHAQFADIDNVAMSLYDIKESKVVKEQSSTTLGGTWFQMKGALTKCIRKSDLFDHFTSAKLHEVISKVTLPQVTHCPTQIPSTDMPAYV